MSATECVVLLHGLGQLRWNMLPIERHLQRQSFATFNLSYPSLRKNISALAELLHASLMAAGIWERYDTVHFVTHSMGGLVAREYLDSFKARLPNAKLGRVVMLAPPHGGSEIADLLHGLSLYKWIYGPAGQELTTGAQAGARAEPWYELGVIAGDAGYYPLGCLAMREQHDGRVAVERTKLKGMKAHLILHASHGFIPLKPSTHRQIVAFLKNGAFSTPAA